MPIIAGIYTRISKDRVGAELGVKRQEADCRTLLEKRGWQLGAVYSDDDVSAFRNGRLVKRRPAFERMKDDLRAGIINAVVYWHEDRLTRNLLELELFLQFCQEVGVRTFASFTGERDLSNEDDLMVLRFQIIFAQKESADKQRRLRRKHREIAQAGRPSGGGSRPYGYCADGITVDPVEAAVIRVIADRILAGESLYAICNHLNAERIYTASGKEWGPSTMRRMMVAPRIAGLRSHVFEDPLTHAVRQELTTAVWKPIITKAQHHRLHAILTDPARRTNRSPRSYLLTGLLRCGCCGQRLVARSRDDRRREYCCKAGPGFSGCGSLSVLAQELEDFVVEAMVGVLEVSPPPAGQAQPTIVDSEEAARLAELEQIDLELRDLGRQYAEGKLSKPSWEGFREAKEDRRRELQRVVATVDRRAALHGFIGNGQALREQWPNLPFDRRRAIAAAMFEMLVIEPAAPGGVRQFRPERVVPLWRM